jgi:phosphopantetheine adenylyltransferase
MDMATASIITAAIAAFASVVVAVIQQFRRENRRDHGTVMDVLRRVSHSMDRVEGKVDSHLEWHIKEANNGKPIRRNKTGSRKAS